MSHGATGQEPEVGDEEFRDATRDQAHARALRKQLQQLAGGGAGEVLREMSREILSGRVGLREALRTPAYAEALGERARTFRQAWERMSPEERERHTTEAQQFLAAQQEEITAERGESAQAATDTFRRAKHRGDQKLGGGADANALGGATAGSASSVFGDAISDVHGRDQVGRTLPGGHEDLADVASNTPISFGLNAAGNFSNDIDAAANGNPGAEEEDGPGSTADALRDASHAKGQQERPDPQRYGAFG
ncbi:hypothetical protein [Streptomyces sp. NPDC054940]